MNHLTNNRKCNLNDFKTENWVHKFEFMKDFLRLKLVCVYSH